MSDSNRDYAASADEEIFRRNILAKVRKYEEIVPLDDGFRYFWIKDRGAMSAAVLRIIADELDRLNAPIKKQMEEDPVFTCEDPLFIRKPVCMTHRFDTANRVCLQCGMTELEYNLRNLRNGRAREQ